MYDDDELLEEEAAEEPQMTQKERNDQNNANNVRNAAEVAIASKNPYAMAAGAAVKAADKVTGGKASEKIGKSITRANKIAPGGRRLQRASNKLSESGASDAIGTAASMKNGAKGGAKGASSASNAGNKAATASSAASNFNNNDSKSSTALKVLKNPIAMKAILILLPIVAFCLIIVAVIAAISDDDSMASGNYYPMPCSEVTVIMTDKNNNYEPTSTATYPLEEYIAGVIDGEVAYLGSDEVNKAFAIAARTYFVAHQDSCTIESSDRYQVFSPNPSAASISAAEETKGKVLLLNNSLYMDIQYDAFACIAEDDNYYTIAQANQKVPKTWLESKINKNSKPEWFICNGVENLQNHHGNGMSQFGSLYLATEQNYDYEQILYYYLGSDITISSNYFNIAGLELKSTAGAKNILKEPISDFLSANGSSLEEYNEFISNSVDSAGFGTRAGVVAAAVSMINYLYDNYDMKLPYYWGGGHEGAWSSNYGILSSVGTYGASARKPSGSYDYYRSFDCSGFVSWAVRNGGYNFSTRTAARFVSSFGSNGCQLSSSGCTGVAGDIIANSGHVQMIVGVNEENGTYYIAESASGVTISEKSMHFGGGYTLLHMDSFYNDSKNVRSHQ